jgi:hypothetical protein
MFFSQLKKLVFSKLEKSLLVAEEWSSPRQGVTPEKVELATQKGTCAKNSLLQPKFSGMLRNFLGGTFCFLRS